MKNILFILGITLLLFSCKKDKLGGFSNSNTECEKNIYEYTKPFDFAPHDSMAWYGEIGWNLNPAEKPFEYPKIGVVKANPNNFYEIIYEKTEDTLGHPRHLYKYNFCSNTLTLLNTSYYLFEWTKKNKIFFFNASSLFRMNSDATNEELIYTASTAPYWIKSSPNGELLMIERKELGLRIFTVITEYGEEISNLGGDGLFLGWYDNKHLLIQYNNEVRKVNVYSEVEEFYLAGKYDSYDPYVEKFLRRIVENEFEGWQTLNKTGDILNVTEFHYNKGIELIHPIFFGESRIISNYWSQEYVSTPYENMLIKQKSVIMNLNGTNARRVIPIE